MVAISINPNPIGLNAQQFYDELTEDGSSGMLKHLNLRDTERIVLVPVLRNSKVGPKKSIPVILYVRMLNLVLSELGSALRN